MEHPPGGLCQTSRFQKWFPVCHNLSDQSELRCHPCCRDGTTGLQLHQDREHTTNKKSVCTLSPPCSWWCCDKKWSSQCVKVKRNLVYVRNLRVLRQHRMRNRPRACVLPDRLRDSQIKSTLFFRLCVCGESQRENKMPPSQPLSALSLN